MSAHTPTRVLRSYGVHEVIDRLRPSALFFPRTGLLSTKSSIACARVLGASKVHVHKLVQKAQ